MRHLALSALGRDRPGIVAAVTGALLGHDLNIEDSQMTILRGHFAMVLLLSGSDSVDVGRLRGELEGVASELELEALSLAEVAPGSGRHPEPTHMIAVYGADHPGIVHAGARAVADHGANITDLNTRLSDEEGSALYVLMMEVTADPERLPALRDALEAVGREEGVEVTLRELEHDEL